MIQVLDVKQAYEYAMFLNFKTGIKYAMVHVDGKLYIKARGI